MILDKVVRTVWVQTYPVRIREERNNFLFISSTARVQLDTGESKQVKKKKILISLTLVSLLSHSHDLSLSLLSLLLSVFWPSLTSSPSSLIWPHSSPTPKNRASGERERSQINHLYTCWGGAWHFFT